MVVVSSFDLEDRRAARSLPNIAVRAQSARNQRAWAPADQFATPRSVREESLVMIEEWPPQPLPFMLEDDNRTSHELLYRDLIARPAPPLLPRPFTTPRPRRKGSSRAEQRNSLRQESPPRDGVDASGRALLKKAGMNAATNPQLGLCASLLFQSPLGTALMSNYSELEVKKYEVRLIANVKCYACRHLTSRLLAQVRELDGCLQRVEGEKVVLQKSERALVTSLRRASAKVPNMNPS